MRGGGLVSVRVGGLVSVRGEGLVCVRGEGLVSVWGEGLVCEGGGRPTCPASCVSSQDSTGCRCEEQHNGCVLVMKNYCCYPHDNNVGIAFK